MKVFVLNCGSSSVKYKLFDMGANSVPSVLAAGQVERIGSEDAIITHKQGDSVQRSTRPIFYHKDAIALALTMLAEQNGDTAGDLSDVQAVGHRVVHGGELFRQSVLVTEDVMQSLTRLNDLAPLHNPHNIAGIEACASLLPGARQVAVFDTALHAHMPPHAYLYPIPYELYERLHIRRYGFHGISHQYVARRVADLMDKPLSELRIISCHLGGGASVAAIERGRSIDTSMGFTPLEGLMMGTRSGDIDPGAVLYLQAHEGMHVSEVNTLLNRDSGLTGISGVGGDMRDVERGVKEGDERATLAFNMYEYRVRKYIGAYAAALNGVDAIAFTAGIGEHSPMLRGRLARHLTYLGVELDESRNEAAMGKEAEISTSRSAAKVFVIPTDEERVIAEDTVAVLREKSG